MSTRGSTQPVRNHGGPTQTIALLPDSPAMNAGDDAAAAGLTTDQHGAGFARITGSAVDVGAFECPNVPPTVALANQTTTLADNISTASRIKVADIVVTDDAVGTSVLSIRGPMQGCSRSSAPYST